MAKKHGTSSGVGITDDAIERLAARAERGLAHTRLRRRGRPPLGDAPARVAQVRLPPFPSQALAEWAEAAQAAARSRQNEYFEHLSARHPRTR